MLRPSFDSIQAIRSFLRPFVWLLMLPVLSQAGEGWKTLGQDPGNGQVCLKCPADCEIRSDRPFFVITHGMNGTREGDRFHLLAETLRSTVPDTNVILIDWSEASCASLIPLVVAWSINSIADEACDDLRNLGFQAERATMIGESFGNYVNARIAANCGQVNHMIAMNPASELGGYPVPDLRLCSRVSWSFHTYSLFDTLQRMAHRSCIIETIPDANEFDRHTAGIRRLIAMLSNSHRLMLPENLGESEDKDLFDAEWAFDGSFKPTLKKREHPTLETKGSPPAATKPAVQTSDCQKSADPEPAYQPPTPSSLVST